MRNIIIDSVSSLPMKYFFTPENDADIKQSYLDGSTIEELAHKYGCSSATLRRRCSKIGMPIRDASERARKYNCNHNYLDRIDHRDKAQLIGFWAADGSLCFADEPGKKYQFVNINLNSKDTDYLEWIREKLGYTGPLYFYKQKGDFTNGKSLHVGLHITSKTLYDSFCRTGLTPRKSLTLKFPTFDQIPQEFIHAYVQGYFEGDGTIGTVKQRHQLDATVNICCTKEWGEFLKEYLKEKLDIHMRLSKRKEIKEHINAWNLSTGGNKQVMKLFNWMYQGASFSMKRKYDRFLQIKDQYNDNGELKYVYREDPEWKKQRSRISREISFNNSRSVKIHLLSPDGYVFYVNSVTRFSQEKNISNQGIYHLIKGRLKSSFGWTVANKETIQKAKLEHRYIEKIYS